MPPPRRATLRAILRRRELTLPCFRKRRMSPAEHPFRDVPTKTSVRHRNSIPQRSRIARKWLIPLVQIAFDHYPNQRARPADTLLDHAAPDIFLSGVLF